MQHKLGMAEILPPSPRLPRILAGPPLDRMHRAGNFTKVTHFLRDVPALSSPLIEAHGQCGH
jgi:hypothetical protein